MNTRKLVALLMALVMAIGLAACAKAPATPATDDTTKDAEPAVTLGLDILKEEDDAMINNYTVIAVNDKADWKDADGNAVADVKINTAGADAFINWLLSLSHWTTIPVGKCVKRTALSVLLTCCPPFPPER